MYLAIKFFEEGNEWGYPTNYPKECKELGDSMELPDLSWTLMTSEEYETLALELRSIKLAIRANMELPSVKQRALRSIKLKITQFIETYLDQRQQMTLSTMMSVAIATGRSNRAAYIAQAWTWIQACLQYYYVVRTDILNMTSAENVLAYSVELSDLAQVAPSVNIEDAMQIMD